MSVLEWKSRRRAGLVGLSGEWNCILINGQIGVKRDCAMGLALRGLGAEDSRALLYQFFAALINARYILTWSEYQNATLEGLETVALCPGSCDYCKAASSWLVNFD